jgi:GTP-binding protein HflX
MERLSRHPRAILVDVIPPSLDQASGARRLRELEALTTTYGGVIVVSVVQRRAIPHYRTYIGSGKLEELIEQAKRDKVQLLILNNALKPRQMFALEEILRPHGIRAWDRVDLILKIFDAHAKTAEAKLQIKLAAVRHMGPRIYGMGLELMRQSGGIGGRGGKGEANTEIMKRHLADQERQLRKELDRLSTSRTLQRRRHDRQGLPTVSVIGYTNAGKSTLVHALTKKRTKIEDALFATLDTRMGHLRTSDGQMILISDTIGFIQDLPPTLLDAFRSTLDETVEADLLLHVIDAADEHYEDKIVEVKDILASIGADQIPSIFVFNKMDAAPKLKRKTLRETYEEHDPQFVSCVTGKGLPELTERIEQRLARPNPPPVA